MSIMFSSGGSAIKRKKLIYIAGALRGEVDVYLQNVSRMLKFSEEVRRLGYAVYVPALDLLQGIVAGTLTFSDYYDNSLEVMCRCDGVILTPGWEDSKGTKHEIGVAISLQIPVYYTIKELKKLKP